jgi:hypothetical protein
MSNKTAIKWIAALSVPGSIGGVWLAARVVSAIGAFYCMMEMVVAKLILMALASTLGAALAHAQGMSGFIYAHDREGRDRMVWAEAYNDLARFGNDMHYLGHAYDGGVRALLYDSRTQAYITYALTADNQNPGKDLVRATLDARNYNPNAPSLSGVFVAGFGGTMIGMVSGSMFASAYGFGSGTGTGAAATGGGDCYTVKQE